MNTIASTAAALSAAALTLGIAASAHAEQYGLDDANDSPHGSDLYSVDVRNGAEDLVVVTRHDNLRRDPRTGSSAAVFVNTDPENPGPEYVFVAGLTDGTDYQLIRTEGFAADKWGDPVEHGDYILRINYRTDVVRFVMSKPALGGAEDVRVAVRVGGTRTDGTSHGLTDWLGLPRTQTPWIGQG